MRVVLLSLTALLAGCDVFSDSLSASLTATAEPPNSVVLALKNTGESTFSLGPIPCEAELEVEEDGDWELADHEPFVVCVDALTLVSPGETVEGSYPMKGVPNGTYRFVVTISAEAGGSTREVVSNNVVVASAGD